MRTLYHLHAELLRTVANHKRLEILELLRNGEANVTRLARSMEVSRTRVSQELAPLRGAGIVRTRREGKTVYYRLANPKVLRACDLVAEAMREMTEARAAAVQAQGRREEFYPRSKQGA